MSSNFDHLSTPTQFQPFAAPFALCGSGPRYLFLSDLPHFCTVPLPSFHGPALPLPSTSHDLSCYSLHFDELLATTMSSKSQAFSCSRLLLGQLLRDSIKSQIYFSRKLAPLSSLPLPPCRSTVSTLPSLGKAYYSTSSASDPDSESIPSNLVQDLLAEVEKDRLRERQQRIRDGLDTKDIDAETQQDYMGVGPILEKLRRQKIKDSEELDEYEEPTDSDSDDDDERFSPEAIQQRFEDFERKFRKHEELLKNFTDAGISPVYLFDLFIIY